MRKSFTASLALVVVLAVAIPGLAAPSESRSRNGKETPALTRVVQLIKKVFGVQATQEPVIPIPAPTTTT